MKNLPLLILIAILLSACSKTPQPLSDWQTPAVERLPEYTLTYSADSVRAMRAGSLVLGLPVGCFLLPDSTPVMGGEVEVRVRLARQPSHFVAAGLPTRSGDRLLLSDGMFHLQARMGDSPLMLNPEVGVYASLFSPNKDTDMRLFVGDTAQDGQLDWTLSEQPEQPYVYDSVACTRCERLIRLVQKSRPKTMAADERDPMYSMRYYWKKGTLYYFGSGVIDTIASRRQLADCEQQVANCANSAELARQIRRLQAEIQAEADVEEARGSYLFYQYRLSRMDWHNLDKYLPQGQAAQQIAGQLLDEDGNPWQGPRRVHIVGQSQMLYWLALSRLSPAAYTLWGKACAYTCNKRARMQTLPLTLCPTPPTACWPLAGPMPWRCCPWTPHRTPSPPCACSP